MNSTTPISPSLCDNQKISIILPTYNRAHMLIDCINNVLSQTYKNIELIIVNDASTDTTREVLSQYVNNPIVTIIHHDINQGTPAALNTGFKKSTGNYLTWTSDDNLLHPKFCSKFLKYFIENSEIDYLYCNYATFKDNINNIKHVNKPLYLNKLDFLINFTGLAGFMWKRKVYEFVGDFDEILFGIEDLDYLLRIIFNNFKFSKINKTLYYYRTHENSITKQIVNTPKYMELHQKMCNKFITNFHGIFADRESITQKILVGKHKPIVKCLLSALSPKEN